MLDGVFIETKVDARKGLPTSLRTPLLDGVFIETSNMFNKKTSTTPTRVYSYALVTRPYSLDFGISNLQIIKDEFWKSSKFYNALIELERIRRSEQNKLEQAHPVLGKALAERSRLEEEVERLSEKVNAAKSRGTGSKETRLRVKALKAKIKADRRSGVAVNLLDVDELRELTATLKAGKPDPADVVALKAARLALKAARKVVKDTREEVKDDLTEAKKQLSSASYEKMKAIRAVAGLRHGTYDRDIRRAKASAKTTPMYEMPGFKSFDGGGHIGTQIIDGITVEQLHACKDTRLQIEPLSEEWHLAFEASVRRHWRRKNHKTTARIRVGTVEKSNAPIWSEFKIHMHRPLPKDAKILWAYLVRKRVGRRFNWELQLTVESESFHPPARSDDGVVAVDLGWRGGRRVAYVKDTAGRETEILAPERFIASVPKVEDLQGIRKGSLNEFLPEFASLLDAIGSADARFQETRKYCHLWKSPKRLAKFASYWRNHRQPGDERALARVESFLKQDNHLLDWESSQRQGMLAHRDEWYKQVCAHLTKTYSTIVLEDTEVLRLTKFAESKKPEDGDKKDGKAARKSMRSAAPGTFRAILLAAASKRGCKVIEQNPSMTTRTCRFCGDCSIWLDPKEVMHRCANCGVTFDRDANGAHNLLIFTSFDVDENEDVLELPKYTAKPRNHPDHLAKRARKLARRAGACASAN